MKKLELIIKNNRFIQKLYIFFGTIFWRFIGLFVRTDDNLVLLSSFSGDAMNDSPLVLYNALREKYPMFKYCWAFKNPSLFPEQILKVKMPSFKYFLYALKARIWITNVNIELGLKIKKKKTIYINTWHGTGPKKAGNARKGRSDYNLPQVDIATADGDYLKNFFINDMGIKESNILMCGRPREDELFLDAEYRQKRIDFLKQNFNIPSGSKLILFAPTYRETTKSVENYSLNLDLTRFATTNGVYILFRGHHNIKKIDGNINSSRIIDVTNYQYLNDLLFASDCLITDYSSIMFDYCYLNKPIICYAEDYSYYRDNELLYFDLAKLFPSGVATDEETLQENYDKINSKENYLSLQANFFKMFHNDRCNYNATKIVLSELERRLGYIS